MDRQMEQSKKSINGRQEDWDLEACHLEFCEEVIQNNIGVYTAKLEQMGIDAKELYDNYRMDNPALHSDLGVSMDLIFLDRRTLQKNIAALEKPYFGRIDYVEQEDSNLVQLYIGKNGISRGGSDIVIVDWRAPVASVYYDSDLGEGSFLSPLDELIPVDLHLKRTFEIHNRKLMDFYDTDVISNDEFLTKYLGKNKEAVLGEIIATIQKEQNEIIRDTPWHNIVVQGVAGSGKTTVAMHRISYILYNFKEKFHPGEFFIIGSNKMLLNYITGVLPNLDVFGVNQMALQEFLMDLLDKDFNYKKRKYKLNKEMIKVSAKTEKERELKKFKASLAFVTALEHYIKAFERKELVKEPVSYAHKSIFTKEDMYEFLDGFDEIPIQEKISSLNKRLTSRIKLRLESVGIESNRIKEEAKKYQNYFGKPKQKYDIMEVYDDFLMDMIRNKEKYKNAGIQIPEREILILLSDRLTEREIDIYDLALLAYIKKKLLVSSAFDFISHIIIDEAQDFGVNIFYVLKRLFKACTFTIMGDVTQNIHYDTGMNDWEELRQIVFSPSRDKFYTLSKSYRNTVEISNYAGSILQKATFQTYGIDPIIRHGNPVVLQKEKNEASMVEKAVEIIKTVLNRGYDTVAVICSDEEETLHVRGMLGEFVDVIYQDEDTESMVFSNGIMVLPIQLTKGLEFDAVVLWNPTEENYKYDDASIKLLYVAVTRALHELFIIYCEELSPLLSGI